MSLRGKVAVVTGASRGIGRGIALQLGEAGAKVYITGREPKKSLSNAQSDLPSLAKTAKDINERGGEGIIAYVDHSNMDEVKNFFQKVNNENNGQLDILVNNAYGGVTTIVENNGRPFWECDPEMWDEINNVGLRNHYFASVYGSRLMVKNKQGLIVNISSSGGLKYLFNVPYGVGKAAMDRMASDMATELKPYNISVVSLWPGAVKTELITKAINDNLLNFGNDTINHDNTSVKNIFMDGESIEFAGKCVVALYNDPNKIKKSGKVLLTADLSHEYGFKDIDGREILGIRNISFLLKVAGFNKVAGYIPTFMKIPGSIITGFFSKI
uniref:Short-chain dehydrogenase n=1 Tax=Parastrongyloides trichosuri TaxID=131310 RepID=A0A0N4ZN28_PARTI